MKINRKKLPFLVMFFWLLGGYFFGVQAQTTSSPHLSLTPASDSETKETNFNVSVNVDTASQAVDGVDAIISYDQNLLQVVSVSEGSFLPTVTSSIATLGTVKIYGVANSGSAKTGIGVLATITFKAKAAGTAIVSFTCQQGLTTDSNINKGGQDIIVCSSNESGSYLIAAAGEAISSSTSTLSAQSSACALPTTGVLKPTILLLAIGIIFSVTGFVFLF